MNNEVSMKNYRKIENGGISFTLRRGIRIRKRAGILRNIEFIFAKGECNFCYLFL